MSSPVQVLLPRQFLNDMAFEARRRQLGNSAGLYQRNVYGEKVGDGRIVYGVTAVAEPFYVGSVGRLHIRTRYLLNSKPISFAKLVAWFSEVK